MTKRITKLKTNHPWKIMEPVRSKINFAMFLSALSVVLNTVILISLGFLIHTLITGGSSFFWLSIIIVTTIITFVLRQQAFVKSHSAAFELEVVLREKMSKNLTFAPLGFILTMGAGRIAKILLDDVKALHIFVADSTPLYAKCYVAPIITFIVLLFISWKMALITLVVLLIGMIILNIVMQKSKKGLIERYNITKEAISNSTIEFVQAMPVVRTFGGDAYSFKCYHDAVENFSDFMAQWYNQNGLSARLSLQILNPIPTIIVLLWTGCYYWMHGQLDFTSWLMILLIGTGMAEALMPYMSLYHMIETAKLSIERIQSVLSIKPLPISSLPKLPQSSLVEFKNVIFQYENREEKALDNLSFIIPENSFTAIVGSSGSGKTTLVRLLPRFWDVTSGEIKIGGVDIKDMTNETLVQQISFVFQDSFLFSGTISENICLGLDNVTENDMIDAAKNAQIHDFIMTLPQGYQTKVKEGGFSLSGGQRQRLTLARALLQNRPILILDEATSYMDAENELLLMKALANITKDKTVLMIAHRLSTIQSADKILILEKGRLLEEGNHEELLRINGRYSTLWQSHLNAQNWAIKTN